VLKWIVFIFYSPNEKRLRAFFRIGLYFTSAFVATLLLSMLCFLFSIPILNGVNPFSFRQQTIDSLFLIIIELTVLFLFIRYIDKRKFSSLGLTIKPIWWKDCLFGSIIGAVIVSIAFGVEYCLGWVEIVKVFYTVSPQGNIVFEMLWPLVLFIAVAIH